MRKKTLALLAIVGLFLLPTLCSFSNVRAYLTIYQPPTQPITDQPIISVSKAVNNSISGQQITFLFTITIPSSWNWTKVGYISPANGEFHDNAKFIDFLGTIEEVKCSIDENVVYDNKTKFGGIDEQSTEVHIIELAPDFTLCTYGSFLPSTISYSIPIGSLAMGPHSTSVTINGYTVWATPRDSNQNTLSHYSFSTSSTDNLMVYAPPTITNLSIENKTYDKPFLPLAFNLNQNTSWLGYSLDNQPNETISGNVTLTDLTEGNHSLVVYANDTFGNMGKSDTISFNIALPAPTPSTAAPNLSPKPTETPVPSPTIPEFPITTLAITVLTLTVLVGAILRARKSVE